MRPHIICMLVFLTLLGTSCQRTASTGKSGLFSGPINGVFKDNPSIVLIVPTGEKNAVDQERILAHVNGIETMIKERGISSNTEIIPDSEALERDLGSNSILVYGTVRGNLWLARHIDKIPVTIELSSIVSDRKYEGTDLRFITAGFVEGVASFWGLGALACLPIAEALGRAAHASLGEAEIGLARSNLLNLLQLKDGPASDSASTREIKVSAPSHVLPRR